MARFTTFTVWSWLLQGIYFTLSAYISASHLSLVPLNRELAQSVLDSTWVLYEVCLSTSILITVVVTFVLFPVAIKAGSEKLLLYNDALLMHNANIIFMVSELILTAVPVNPFHFVFAILWGALYVVFSWFWLGSTGVVYYFFLDYRKPRTALYIIGLIAALSVFYFLGYGVSTLGPRTGMSPLLTSILTLAATFSVLKFKK